MLHAGYEQRSDVDSLVGSGTTAWHEVRSVTLTAGHLCPGVDLVVDAVGTQVGIG